jgi:DNA-binding NtrC family response regulator
LRLVDNYVSARHAVIERRDGRLLVRDLNSKNGTYVNESRVRCAVLSRGCRLRLGRQTLHAVTKSRQASPFATLIGSSPSFSRAVNLARRAAASHCNVLILGETGTGKELFANAIHRASTRHAGPFVALNCGGIASDLAASELFGHERGAFTGATTTRDGVFVEANGGTLFLDELGELPPHQQPHLLRALETGKVKRVGGNRAVTVDVRVVAATNADIGPGSRLRADLYHRIATIVIALPPLRERVEDIAPLVRAFIDELAPTYGPRRISEHTLSELSQHNWPGNVRELHHAVHRAAALCDDELELSMMLPQWRGTRAQETPALRPIDAHVRTLMESAYRRHGSVRAAAQSLGMAKSTFSDRAARYGLKLGKAGKGDW